MAKKKRKVTRCPTCKAKDPKKPWYVMIRRGKVIGKASEPFGGLPRCPDPFHGRTGWF